MKGFLPKNLLLPALFGLAFYLSLFLFNNIELVSNYPTLNLVGIILATLVLYGVVFGVINNRLNIALGLSGFRISQFLFAFIIPFSIFIYQTYFYKPKEQFKSILEKEGISLVGDNVKCHPVKYGKFTNGFDTIICYREEKADFEKVKSVGDESVTQIRWIDSCAYLRINENGLVLKHIQLGNFKSDGTHDLYSKPAAMHELWEEKIERITALKN